MAAIAIGRGDRGGEVAKVARRRDVRAGQREASGAVVEHRIQPICHVVARIAIGWIRLSDVIRNRAAQSRRALILRVVATDASSRQCSGVIPVHMALGAQRRCRCVRADQRENGRTMIERGTRPIRSRMANRTILRKPGRDVVRNRAAQSRRAVPIRSVAGVADRGSQRVIVVHMAGHTRRRHRRNVHSRQGKSRRAVVKGRRGKADRRVAIGAIGDGK